MTDRKLQDNMDGSKTPESVQFRYSSVLLVLKVFIPKLYQKAKGQRQYISLKYELHKKKRGRMWY